MGLEHTHLPEFSGTHDYIRYLSGRERRCHRERDTTKTDGMAQATGYERAVGQGKANHSGWAWEQLQTVKGVASDIGLNCSTLVISISINDTFSECNRCPRMKSIGSLIGICTTII